jgi:hypothetical protein
MRLIQGRGRHANRACLVLRCFPSGLGRVGVICLAIAAFSLMVARLRGRGASPHRLSKQLTQREYCGAALKVAGRKAILVLRLRELDFLRYGNSKHGAALELVYVAGAQ